MTAQLTTGALFAGYGGLDLAVEHVLDAQTRWVAEVDTAPSRILAARFPHAPNLGDVTAVNWSDVEPVDVITGGFPCQDVSHAGRRAGLIRGETRTGLWANMLAAIDTIRPRLVVAENVRGLLSARADSDVEPCPWCMGDRDASPMRALGAVLADLADLGYDAAWHGLRAADVGAPHGRFRVFIVAWPAANTDRNGFQGIGRIGAVGRDADRLGGPGQEAAGPALLRTPTAQLAINGGSQHPDKRRLGGHGPTLADEVEHLLPTPAVNDMGRAYTPEQWDQWTDRMKAAHGNGNGHGKSLEIEAQRLLPTPRATDGTKGGPNQRGTSGDLMLPSAATRLLPTPRTENNENRQSERFDPNQTTNFHGLLNGRHSWGDYGDAIARWEHLTRPAPSPTEPTGKNGAHRLSPRFVEWMMGLPDGWVTDADLGLTRNQQLKALGNGVVPQQAAAGLVWLLNATRAVGA